MPSKTSTPLKVALVGTGSIARFHLPAFRDHPDIIELVAVCDVVEAAAQETAASVREGIPAYTDLGELLEHGEFDAVDICTPHDLHAPQSIAAAAAGKHVFVEKPMACSVPECRAMVAAADAAGVTLMVGQVLRYLPTSHGIRDLLEQEAIGRLWWARADDWFPGAPPAGWMADAKRAGGGVLQMGSTHHIDLFRFFFGDVAAVRAHTWTGNPHFKNGAEDRVAATLEFENGVVAQLSAGWSLTAPHFFQYLLMGDAGSISSELPQDPTSLATMLWQHHAPGLVRANDEACAQVPAAQAGLIGTDPFANELVHFAECVRSGDESISSGRDNLGTMEAVYACYESARLGHEVLVGHQ